MCPCNFTSAFNFLKVIKEGNQKIEVRKFQYRCGVIAQNFLLNYFLFKITLNPSKKVEFPSEKPKDMSDDGTEFLIHQNDYWQKLKKNICINSIGV